MGLIEDFKKFMKGDMAREVAERVDACEDFRPLSGADYDEFGASSESLKKLLPPVLFFYKFYFRTEVFGLENVAGLPRAVIVPNHMVQAPVDGLNIGCSLFWEPERPRLLRAVGHHVLASNPFVSVFVSRSGQVIGTDENVERVFSGDNLVLIFPEGTGTIRPYSRRYRLNKFNVGFMEYAIRHGYPVVPTAVIGSEESTLVLAEVKQLRGFLGIPRFAITPTFPLLGVAGMVPYPAKFRIYYGEPMDFTGHRDSLDDPAAVRGLVEQVRDRVQSMLDERLAELPAFPFF